MVRSRNDLDRDKPAPKTAVKVVPDMSKARKRERTESVYIFRRELRALDLVRGGGIDSRNWLYGPQSDFTVAVCH